jgi:hypothetical protein
MQSYFFLLYITCPIHKKTAMFILSIYFLRLARFLKEHLPELFLLFFISILIDIFLPYRRANITASALYQGIRSEGPHLHALCLASAATLTRE